MTSSVLACEVVKVTLVPKLPYSPFSFDYGSYRIAFGGVIGDMCAVSLG